MAARGLIASAAGVSLLLLGLIALGVSSDWEHDSGVSLESHMDVARANLKTARNSLLAMQKRATNKHQAAAAQANHAAHDRRLEKRLSRFAKVRQGKAQNAEDAAKHAQGLVKQATTHIHRLNEDIHRATQSIRTFSQKAHKLLASKPKLAQEIKHVDGELGKLRHQHALLEAKAGLLAAGATPYAKRGRKEAHSVHRMVLKANQLKAKAQLVSAQAKIIADNLHSELAKLRADGDTTAELKQESQAIPSPGEATLKFKGTQSLAVQHHLAKTAKTVMDKATEALEKTKQHDALALVDQHKLLSDEKMLTQDDQRAASIDLAAAKERKVADRNTYLAKHLEAEAAAARHGDAGVQKQQRSLARKKEALQRQLKAIGPGSKKARDQIKKAEALLARLQTSLDETKVSALQSAKTVLAQEHVVNHQVKMARLDLSLAVGASEAAGQHESSATKLSEEANGFDRRVDELDTTLKDSTSKLEAVDHLEKATHKAKKELSGLNN